MSTLVAPGAARTLRDGGKDWIRTALTAQPFWVGGACHVTCTVVRPTSDAVSLVGADGKQGDEPLAVPCGWIGLEAGDGLLVPSLLWALTVKR